MFKQILMSVGAGLAAALLIVAVISTTGGTNFAGLTHFSGISVGEDGLEVEGTSSFDGEIRASLIEKGSVTTLAATSTPQVLTAAQVCNSNVISWNNTTASSTLTLPSAANLVADCLTENGDSTSFLFNSTSASTTVVTIVAGSNIDLVGPSANDDLIDNGKKALIVLWRVSSTSVIASVEELTAAD